MHTGERLRKRPSVGAWINYGLGSENENLPGLISLNAAKPSVYSSAFLPPVFEGTNGENMSEASIRHIARAAEASGKVKSTADKRRQVDLMQTKRTSGEGTLPIIGFSNQTLEMHRVNYFR